MELFNDIHFRTPTSSNDATFPLFPRLPIELRLLVWSRALRRRRWIPLDIVLPGDDPNGDWPAAPPRVAPGASHEQEQQQQQQQQQEEPPASYYMTRNSMGRVVSGKNYHFAVHDDGSTLSPLLRVNREARKTALEFYRIRLPVRHCLPQAQGRPLYLNPECDILFLRWARVPRLLADVLHDIRAYDARDVGVVHLAVAACNRYGGSIFAELSRGSPTALPKFWEAQEPELIDGLSRSTMHPIAAASLADTLGDKLRSVFCIVDFLGGSRIRSPLETSFNLTLHYGRGHPLQRHLSSVTFLDWLPRDPRPVGADLRLLQFMKDPRRYSEEWRDVEALFRVARQPHASFSFYICPSLDWQIDRCVFEPRDRTRLGLEAFLDYEKREWHRHCNMVGELFGLDAGGQATFLDRQMLRAKLLELRDVVGMWVLEPDAFGMVDAEKRAEVWERFKGRYDVSATWPGLVVFDNPAA